MVRKETIAILKLLIDNKEKFYTIRELSKIRNINCKSAYEVVKKLEKEESIKVIKKGNTKLCSFNNKLTSNVYLAEKERLNDLLKIKDIKVIYKELEKINNQFIVIIFGSYEKNTQTKHSHIDLLIINNSLNIQEKLSILPLNIHLTQISYEEFVDMLLSKKFNVVNEALKNNVTLIGLEDYYRLINNAL